tara:strand:- start:670 stop:855 length:186 start_codon:yes stop_codon:yes gene_type:complete
MAYLNWSIKGISSIRHLTFNVGQLIKTTRSSEVNKKNTSQTEENKNRRYFEVINQGGSWLS